MTDVNFIVLLVAAVSSRVELCIEPTLADRVIALNSVVLAGMGDRHAGRRHWERRLLPGARRRWRSSGRSAPG